jgi:hypothetical protein
VILVLPGPQGDGEPWRVIQRTEGRSDVLAHVPRPGRWQSAVERIRDMNGELDVVQVADGHYRWLFEDECGALIAASPAIHRDAWSCRHAFTDTRRAARSLLGDPVWQ